jgi:hypothetical protein
MAVDPRDVDPAMAFEIGQGASDRLKEYMRDEFPLGYCMGVVGLTGVGKSSFLNCIMQKFVAPMGSTGVSTTLSVQRFKKSAHVRLVDLAGLDVELVDPLLEHGRIDSLRVSAEDPSNASAHEAKEHLTLLTNMSAVFRKLKEGCCATGTLFSWQHGTALDRETKEPTGWPDPNPLNKVHGMLVIGTVRDIEPKYLSVTGNDSDGHPYKIKDCDDMGDATPLANRCKQLFNLYSACSTTVGVPCVIVITGLDHIEKYAARIPGDPAEMVNKADRVEFLKKKIAQLCNVSHLVHFVNSKDGHEASPGTCSKALLQALEVVDRQEQDLCEVAMYS